MSGNKSLNTLSKWVRKNLPTILTWASAVATAGALYYTGKATVKAVRTYDELKQENPQVSKKEVVKAVIPYYIPAAGFAATSIACSFGSNHINAKRQRVLAGALMMSNEALQSFKKKVEEKLEPKKLEEITQEQAQEKHAQSTAVLDPQDRITVFDKFTHFKFETTYSQLSNAMFEVNRRLNHNDGFYCGGSVPYSDFYRWMGVNVPEPFRAYSWDTVLMHDEFDTSWVDFFMKDMQDVNGLPITILEYSINPTIDSEYR